MLTRLNVLIILQCMQILNHYLVQVKQKGFISVIPQEEKSCVITLKAVSS